MGRVLSESVIFVTFICVSKYAINYASLLYIKSRPERTHDARTKDGVKSIIAHLHHRMIMNDTDYVG